KSGRCSQKLTFSGTHDLPGTHAFQPGLLPRCSVIIRHPHARRRRRCKRSFISPCRCEQTSRLITTDGTHGLIATPEQPGVSFCSHLIDSVSIVVCISPQPMPCNANIQLTIRAFYDVGYVNAGLCVERVDRCSGGSVEPI